MYYTHTDREHNSDYTVNNKTCTFRTAAANVLIRPVSVGAVLPLLP